MTCSVFITSTACLLLVMAMAPACSADKDGDLIKAVPEAGAVKSSRNVDEANTPSLWPEIVSQLPVSKLYEVGSKALNVARFWPAGLASLVVGTAPTTGAIVGVISISIFVIVIWLVIYSIGVLPVGSAFGRYELFDGPLGYAPPGLPAYGPGHPLVAPRPYAYSRFQRSLADASQSVMNAMDQFKQKQQ